MKILKEGKTKEELEAIMKCTQKFRCSTCECIFEADNGEYEYEDNYYYAVCYCECPNCHHKSYEIIG